MNFSEQEGRFLVKLARAAIESAFGKKVEIEIPKELEDKLSKPAGVFVTLKKNSQLRGCIGYPYPVLPLGVALLRAAREAAFGDPRFPPLREDELNEVKIEVSILSKPEKIEAEPGEQPKKITVPQDGLIVRKGGQAGLLLPQVAAEFGWSAAQFLSQACVKAGLDPDCWKREKIELYKFQAQIFKED